MPVFVEFGWDPPRVRYPWEQEYQPLKDREGSYSASLQARRAGRIDFTIDFTIGAPYATYLGFYTLW